MASKMVEFFWEHPVRFILRLFLTVVALCLLLTFRPKWFNVIFPILLFGALITMIIRNGSKVEKSKQKKERTRMEDYEKMYAELGDLVSRKTEELGAGKVHIHSDWFQTFYVYIQEAARLCYRAPFTDFHIAACIIFSLVSYADDIEHTEIIYKCVRKLIAKPRVYIRHIDDADVITLETKKTLPEVDLRVIEDVIDPVEFAKIIKEMYIKNKSRKAFTELADFLKRIYLSCT